MKQVPKAKIPLLTYRRMAKQDLIGLRTMIFEKYGDIYWNKVRGVVNYAVAHPIYAKHILEENQDNYFFKHPLLIKAFKGGLGARSLFATNDRRCWHQRRTTNAVPLEPKIFFQEYADTIVYRCNKMLDRWRSTYKNGQYINIARELDRFVLGIIDQTLLRKTNLNIEAREEDIFNLWTLTHKQLSSLPFMWRLSSDKRTFKKITNFLRNHIQNKIMKQLNNSIKWNDFTGYLIDEFKISSKDDLEEVADQVFTPYLAAYFNLTSLLHWMLVELSRHPEIERQIAHDVDRVLSGRLPTYKDVPSFSYLPLVIKELLRLHPPSFSMMRQAISDDSINGFFIPKGAGITISAYHLHRHPDFWTNPEGLDPERFRDNPLGQANHFAYLPFGSGKRICIGSGFALLTANLFAACLIQQKFHFYLPPHAIVKPFVTTIFNMRPNVNTMKLQYA